MFLVKPSFEILSIMGYDPAHEMLPCDTPIALIEHAGRTCYKSEDQITATSAINFVKMILKRGHESVLEHSAVTVKFVIDRGVSHEWVRHRLCAFSQESTRYCNYKGGVTFVIPPWVDIDPGDYDTPDDLGGEDQANYDWAQLVYSTEETYMNLLHLGWSPQQARSVLPNSLKTELVVTANFREWRHIFKLRTAKAAHPQMQEIMIPTLKEFQKRVPVIFDGIGE
ncbi:MAG: FAD-dependent thymidylate synthase [Planctomycetes bacterium]|nr:FAD-dependent thymidylate synthase [Planctomycetota bacterium]